MVENAIVVEEIEIVKVGAEVMLVSYLLLSMTLPA